MTPKVFRAAYQRARQGELSPLAGYVLQQITQEPAFATLTAEAQALTSALETYRTKLARALSGSIPDRHAKLLARRQLLTALDAVADALEPLAQQHPEYLELAGFSSQRSRGTRYRQHLAVPTLLSAGATGARGEVRVVLHDEVPEAVRTHAVAVSYDRGANWTVWACNTRRYVLLSGLPSTPHLWIRVAAIGPGGKQSDWSRVVEVGVV